MTIIEQQFEIHPGGATMTESMVPVAPAASNRAARTAAPVVARPRRGSGSRPRARSWTAAPEARPARAVPAPGLERATTSRARACTGVTGPTAATAAWRLTDRGIAVVLVVAAMVTVAALTVVGLTALRVTSADYVPAGQSALLRG